MAILTKYNLHKLCQKLEIKEGITLEKFVEHIYNDEEIYFMLTKREIENIFINKMLLADEKKFYAEYYKEVPEKLDSKTQVFNIGGKMKYHLKSNCIFLNKDYLDFSIPEEIRKLGDFAIQEFREWFKSNKFAEKFKNGEIGIEKIKEFYNLKYPLFEGTSEFIIFNIPNSKSSSVENCFDYNLFITEMNALKIEWSYAFQSPVIKKLSKYKYLLYNQDDEIRDKICELFSDNFTENFGGLEKLKSKLKIAEKLTTRMIYLLNEYIKWKFNFNEKKFDLITLENFGLECCKACKNETID